MYSARRRVSPKGMWRDSQAVDKRSARGHDVVEIIPTNKRIGKVSRNE